MSENNKDKKAEIAFWGIDGPERLTCESLDDAVEKYLEDSVLEIEDMPDTLEVVGYARKKIDADGWGCLEDLLMHLDDNYADPDRGGTDPTEKMKEAEHVFVTSVLSEYVPSAYSPVMQKTIDVKKWIIDRIG